MMGMLTRIVLLALVLYPLAVSAQDCPRPGDVTDDGFITPRDALLALQHALSGTGLQDNALACAKVLNPQSNAVTLGDALCIFQRFLGLVSCLNPLQPRAGGDQFIGRNQATGLFPLVTLDGRSSRARGGDALVFQWDIELPAGSSAVLGEATTSMPMFTPDVDGIYRGMLTVTDTQGTTAQDTVAVSAQTPLNIIPEPCSCTGVEGDTISLSAQVVGGESPTSPLNQPGAVGILATNAPPIPNWPVTVTLRRGDGFLVDNPACTVVGRRATGEATVLVCLTDAEGFVTSSLVLGAEPEHIVSMQARGVPTPIFFCTNIDDRDGDCLPDALEMQPDLDADRSDTDGDGIPDGLEDLDTDGLSNLGERVLGTDLMKRDTNGDGIDDGAEDTDGDALPDGEEVRVGTNPSVMDSDGDGWNDEVEVTAGSDPLDITSRPRLLGVGALSPAITLPAIGDASGFTSPVIVSAPPLALTLPATGDASGFTSPVIVSAPPLALTLPATGDASGLTAPVIVGTPPVNVTLEPTP